MKQHREKGSVEKKMRLVLAVVMIALLITLSGNVILDPMPIQAETEDTTSDSEATTTEEDLQAKYNKLKSNKEDAKSLLATFQTEKDNVVTYIDKLDRKLEELEDDISVMKSEQKEIQTYLDKVQGELDQDRINEEVQYSAMKKRIKYLYEHGNNSFLDAFTGSHSFGDMLNLSNNISKIQTYDNKLLKNYRKSLQAIDEKEAIISEKSEELAQVKLDLETERDSVSQLIDDKSEELKTYNHNIKAAGNLIAEYEKSLAEQEKLMSQQEQYASDDSNEMYSSLPSEYTGGKLLWPVPGHYHITSPFGYRVHPLTGTRRLHGGIDISLPTGCGVYAAADGVVAISVYSSSAGNYVMINHGGGLSTVYMHNSKLLVKAGQKVKRGQKIALSGSTGWSTGPHCHFGVRKNGTYVNPIPYLKSTKSSDDTDYSDEETEIPDEDPSTPTTEEVKDKDDKAKDTSNYTSEADDKGDNGKKSSDLKDDGDPDSE